MSHPQDLLLVQVIQRERLEEAERRRTVHRLRQQRKQLKQSHPRRQRTGIARWLHDWLTA